MAETLQADEQPQQRAALNGELEQAIAGLPEPLRIVVELRDIEQLRAQAAAQRLGLSEGAVKVRLHRSRLKLREALSAYLTSPTETEDEQASPQP